RSRDAARKRTRERDRGATMVSLAAEGKPTRRVHAHHGTRTRRRFDATHSRPGGRSLLDLRLRARTVPSTRFAARLLRAFRTSSRARCCPLQPRNTVRCSLVVRAEFTRSARLLAALPAVHSPLLATLTAVLAIDSAPGRCVRCLVFAKP